MAAQWQANPTYSSSPTPQWIQDAEFSDLESVQPSVALTSPATVSGEKKKEISNLPPFDINPKKISSKNQSLAISVEMKRDLFLTNGHVQGTLHIQCQKEANVKLGKITVFLIGFEETVKSAPRNFFIKRWIIQDTKFAPSDAVFAGVLDEDGMWSAKKGATQFDFSIPFQKEDEEASNTDHIVSDLESDNTDLPCSYWNSKVGGIRYIVAAVVENKVGLKIKTPLAFYREVFVIEGVGYTLSNTFANLSPRTESLLKEQKTTIKSGFLGFGKKGDLTVKASLRTLRINANNLEPGVWKSGDTAYIGVDIQNESPKKVVFLKVSLVRILKTFKFDSVGYRPVSFAKLIGTSATFVASKKDTVQKGRDIRGKNVANGWAEDSDVSKNAKEWVGVPSGQSLQSVVHLDIPNWARTVRNASLIDVSFEIYVQVRAVSGSPIEINIPITILHPASVLEESPRIDITSPPPIKPASTGHISYVTVSPPPPVRTPSPQEEVEPEVKEVEQAPTPVVQSTFVLPDPANAETDEKDINTQDPVFTSQSTLADTPLPAIGKSATLSSRRNVAPLKSFLAVSRSATARRAPLISRPSPVSLKAMPVVTLEPLDSSAPTVVEKEGARIVGSEPSATSLLDDGLEGVAKFDLDSEIDKMFDVVKLQPV